MTRLPDRPETALLVIDVQTDVVADAHERDAVVANIAALVERARAAGVALVWVQHSDDELSPGSPGWELVTELSPANDEPVVHKRYGDAFEDTDLETVLAAHRVGAVVITGAETDACIRATLHGALVRGYDVTLVADAHTTADRRPWGCPIGPAEAIGYTNLYWAHTSAPGRATGVLSTAEVTFAAPSRAAQR